MGKSVLDSLSAEDQARLTELQQELEGQDLVPLLARLMNQFNLSTNQTAISATMDESAFRKILAGEHREMKADQVDALLDDLETLGKLVNPHEKTIWRRALRIAAYQHYDFYKSVEPRLQRITDPEERERVLAEHLSNQYPALAATYDSTSGQFPAFAPLAYAIAHHLLRRWDLVSPSTETEQISHKYSSWVAKWVPKKGTLSPIYGWYHGVPLPQTGNLPFVMQFMSGTYKAKFFEDIECTPPLQVMLAFNEDASEPCFAVTVQTSRGRLLASRAYQLSVYTGCDRADMADCPHDFGDFWIFTHVAMDILERYFGISG